MAAMNVLVSFSGRPQVRPFLDRLSHTAGLKMNVVRGRMTPSDARYEIVVRGPRVRLARALQDFRGNGIDVRIREARGSASDAANVDIS